MPQSHGDQRPPGLAEWMESQQGQPFARRMQELGQQVDDDIDVDELDDLTDALAAALITGGTSSSSAPPRPAVERQGEPQSTTSEIDTGVSAAAEVHEPPEPSPPATTAGVLSTDDPAVQGLQRLPDLGEYTPTPPTYSSADLPTPSDPAPVPSAAPSWDDRYNLWSPPQPEPLVVPDDIESITPTQAPTYHEPTPAPDPLPDAPADAAVSLPSPSGKRTAGQRWAALPGWSRMAIPVVATVLVAALLIAALSGGDAEQHPQAVPPPVPVAPPTISPPSNGPLQPSKVEAPNCPAGSSPDPSGAFDVDKRRGWICGRRAGIDNAILTITFPEAVVVCEIKVVPGFDYVEPNGADRWNEHRLVTKIVWRIGGQRLFQSIAPTRAPATLSVPCLATNVITATIQGTEPPPAAPTEQGGLPGIFGAGPDSASVDETFAIGRIEIIGRPASGG